MNSLVEMIKRWYQALPRSGRWAVWAFAGVAGGFTLLLAGLNAAAGTANPAAPGSLSAGGTADSAAVIFDVVIKLVVVLLLIYVSAAAYKKWNQRTPLGVPQKMLKIRETTRLSARQALHVVEVNGELLLIGATDQSITLLTAVDSGGDPVQPAGQPGADFGRILNEYGPAKVEK